MQTPALPWYGVGVEVAYCECRDNNNLASNLADFRMVPIVTGHTVSGQVCGMECTSSAGMGGLFIILHNLTQR